MIYFCRPTSGIFAAKAKVCSTKNYIKYIKPVFFPLKISVFTNISRKAEKISHTFAIDVAFEAPNTFEVK